MANHNIQETHRKQTDFFSNPEVPQIGSVWRHYKGTNYVIEGHCMLESNEEMAISYSEMNQPLLVPWVRPYSEWIEMVEHNGVKTKRFTFVRYATEQERTFH